MSDPGCGMLPSPDRGIVERSIPRQAAGVASAAIACGTTSGGGARARGQLAATPLAMLMRERSREQQASLTDAVVADVAAALPAHIRDGALVVPKECHILSTHRIDG
jgi:hypothetical protein